MQNPSFSLTNYQISSVVKGLKLQLLIMFLKIENLMINTIYRTCTASTFILRVGCNQDLVMMAQIW